MTTHPHRLTRVLRQPQRLFAALALLSACSPADGAGAADEGAAKRLDGVWEASFVLERPVIIGTAPDTTTRPVIGSIALLREAAGHADIQGARATHAGLVNVDFSRFGILRSHAANVPAVLARLGPDTARDSVTLVIDPESRGAIRLNGVLAGDSIVGGWGTSRGIGGGGRFTMRRRKEGSRGAGPE